MSTLLVGMGLNSSGDLDENSSFWDPVLWEEVRLLVELRGPQYDIWCMSPMMALMLSSSVREGNRFLDVTLPRLRYAGMSSFKC